MVYTYGLVYTYKRVYTGYSCVHVFKKVSLVTNHVLVKLCGCEKSKTLCACLPLAVCDIKVGYFVFI